MDKMNPKDCENNNNSLLKRVGNFCNDKFRKMSQNISKNEIGIVVTECEYLRDSNSSDHDLARSLQVEYGHWGNAQPINLFEHSEEICSKFTLQSIIGLKNGAGKFGRVWSGAEKSGQLYALKCISPLFNDKKFIKTVHLRRSQREAHYLNCVQHSNIAKFYQATFVDSIHMIIKMEFLPTEMNEICAKPWRMPSNVRRFVSQIGSALCYLHQKHIAHHDVKIENIMLDRPMLNKSNYDKWDIELLISVANFKLCDFGFAKQYSPDCPIERHLRLGTNYYKCIEKFQPNLEYNPYQADAFSFGVCLLIVLVGHVEFCDQILKQEKCAESYLDFFTKNGHVFTQKIAFELLKRGKKRQSTEEETAYALLDSEKATSKRPARITIADAMSIFKHWC